MKTKLTGFLIILSIAIISCNTDVQQENNDLLTSTNWTTEQRPPVNVEILKFPEPHYTFHKNGDYTFESGKLKLIGQWKWIAKNEIYLEWESIIVSGTRNDFDKKQNYYIRIIEISESNLKTLVRFETDSWDSGFTEEVNYKPI